MRERPPRGFKSDHNADARKSRRGKRGSWSWRNWAGLEGHVRLNEGLSASCGGFRPGAGKLARELLRGAFVNELRSGPNTLIISD